MKILEIFKVDVWWKLMIVVSLLLGAASIMFPIDFINSKHLFGLAIGMFLIGISYFMAQRYIQDIVAFNLISQAVIKHNLVTILILLSGIGLTGLFLYLIVKGLIV